ncbi:MAG: Hsp33 family molecular chaperone HslO [Myxococcota bacterium]
MPQCNVFVRGLTHGVDLRYVLADVTDAAKTAQHNHTLNTASARLCTEAMIATTLLANQIKGEERLTVMLASNFPKCTFMADVNALGQLRAKLTPNNLTNSSVLNGQLQVIKHNSRKELYRGVTELNNQSIEDAIQHHLKQSSQISNLLRICCIQDESGQVIRATGLLLELLPPTKQIESLNVEKFERKYSRLRTLPSQEVIEMLDDGKLIGQDLFPLEKMDTKWTCTCSRERVERMLFSLGPSELKDMLETDGQAEVCCDFCNNKYHFDSTALEKLLNQFTDPS